jgi:hypothetical protein
MYVKKACRPYKIRPYHALRVRQGFVADHKKLFFAKAHVRRDIFAHNIAIKRLF